MATIIKLPQINLKKKTYYSLKLFKQLEIVLSYYKLNFNNSYKSFVNYFIIISKLLKYNLIASYIMLSTPKIKNTKLFFYKKNNIYNFFMFKKTNKQLFKFLIDLKR